MLGPAIVVTRTGQQNAYLRHGLDPRTSERW